MGRPYSLFWEGVKPEEGEIQFWSICYPNDVATVRWYVYQPWLETDWKLFEVTELLQLLVKWQQL